MGQDKSMFNVHRSCLRLTSVPEHLWCNIKLRSKMSCIYVNIEVLKQHFLSFILNVDGETPPHPDEALELMHDARMVH